MPMQRFAFGIDLAFRQAGTGDRDAFAAWMGLVEIPIRRSLSRFARAVDVEVVVQETLLRMWLVASDPDRVLEGENASLKFAFRVARLVALEEMRRWKREKFIGLDELENLPEGVLNVRQMDPFLGRAIRECTDRLPEKPRKAIGARIHEGHRPDRELARSLAMKANTFLQNIVRARKLLADCLSHKGVRLEEFLQ